MTPEASKENLDPQRESLAILDAGAQYGKVIDRRIRGLNVHCEVLPIDTPIEDLAQYRAFVISGSPGSVYEPGAAYCDPRLYELGKPILGICYGMQVMNHQLGGVVAGALRREDGQCDITIEPSSAIFAGMDVNQSVLMSHGDSIETLAPGFRATADSNGIIAAIEDPQRQLYGVQFHPEVDLTAQGKTIFSNFLYEVSGLQGDYTIEDRLITAVEEIRERVAERKVISFLSGGVDSTVATIMAVKALGPERVRAIHIDTGFMRTQESQNVVRALAHVGLQVEVVDASEIFYSKLKGVTEPEDKREIIGNTFIDVLRQLDKDDDMLIQGTLRPDLIESASKLASQRAAKIKTHHNDSTEARKMRDELKIVEPLKDLHKDEVRELGTQLGLPDEIVWRHPFPGPGLAIRLICSEVGLSESEDNLDLERFETSEISVRSLPVRTVGVQGDGRSYGFLTGLSGEKNWNKLFEKAREIPKYVHRINRVVYVYGDRVHRSQEVHLTQTFIEPQTVNQLRLADEIVNEMIAEYDLVRKISQFVVASVPLSFDEPGQRSIVLRPFITNDFMTGRAAIPGVDLREDILDQMAREIPAQVPGISRVMLDLTGKPPGTTEWE